MAEELLNQEAASESVDIQMNADYLYDFFLYHTYSKFSGFLINVLGFAVFILGAFSYYMGQISGATCAIFILAALLFVSFNPLQLKRRAKKAMKLPNYREPLNYTFRDDVGIEVKGANTDKFYDWMDIKRAAVAPKTVILYVDDNEALILPKPAFTKEQFVKVYKMIAINLGRAHKKRALALAEAETAGAKE